MKNRIFLFLLALTGILMTASAAGADGAYPVPRFYPIGQENPGYTPPVNYYNGQTVSDVPNNTQPYPYYYQNQNQYYYPPQQQQQNQYYYPPQNTQPNYQNPSCGQPYYDPYTQQYYNVPCVPYQPPYQPYQPPQQPYRPQQQSNVEVQTRQGKNNTLNVTWTIRNITSQDWNNKEVDILCKDGCGLLTGRTTRWDLPYWVRRNDMLSFTVNTRQVWPGDHMTFQIIEGSKVLYTFSVYPY